MVVLGQIVNMDDVEEGRSSDSVSSSSGVESTSSQRPSLSTSPHNGLKNGVKKRQHRDSGLELDLGENPQRKTPSEGDFDAAENVKQMKKKIRCENGAGLGKGKQESLEQSETSKQGGRRDLDLINEHLEKAYFRWNPNEEVIMIQKEIIWFTNTKEPPTTNEFCDWMRLGRTKRTIEDETLFCDAKVVSGVVCAKSVFDHLDHNEMREGRTRSNPFETIGDSIFLNRGAVEMAEMDRACNYLFTAPGTLKSDELLYFADVCGGPGGFSEYVLWRRNWRAKGFGLTLRDTNDFKLQDFYAGSPKTFHPYYGPKDDGNIYNPANQGGFREMIMHQTHGKGVHFMMSDGSFSVKGEENIQEILSKQLYLCQCLLALMIVREGGHFITKLFDIFTSFSAGLVYIMSRCFRSIAIFKPNSSRPADSERYLICKGRLPNVEEVIAYLSCANHALLEQKKGLDVMQLVPYHLIKQDQEFYNFLKSSNENLGREQIIGLLKIAAFCENMTLVECRQAEIRKKSLEYFGLPDTNRTIPRMSSPDEHLKTLLKKSTTTFMMSKPTLLRSCNIKELMSAQHDWFCMVCGSSGENKKSSATFYMGTSGSKSFRYDDGTWVKVPNLHLSPKTLVYAELILETREINTLPQTTEALHILDAYFLGGEDVSENYIEERYRLTKLYTKALWKPTNGDWIRVRAKELFPLVHDLESRMNFKHRTLKDGGQSLTHTPSRAMTHYDDTDTSFSIVPRSVLFVKNTAKHWSRHVSRTNGYGYYFNSKDNTTVYNKDKPATADASFTESFMTRILWSWPRYPEITRDTFFQIVRNKCVRFGKK